MGFSGPAYGASVKKSKKYTDDAIGQAQGVMLIGEGQTYQKLSQVPNPTEALLYRIITAYIEDDVEWEKGFYSYDSNAHSFSLLFGDTFTDFTEEFKSNEWNQSHGHWSDENEVQCIMLYGQLFVFGKYIFNTPIIDVSERHKSLEFPVTFPKKKEPIIRCETYTGPYKTFEAARHYYYDEDGEGYINPEDYETTKFQIKDLIVNEDGYAEQEIDERGELVWLGDWTSSVRPNLKHNVVEIDATRDYEVNRVLRDYQVACQWVELDRSKFVIDIENQSIQYGDSDMWIYHGGLKADRPSGMDVGDFYYATDEDKLYRYVNNLYKTYKWTTKVNADYIYKIALVQNGCNVDSNGRVSTPSSTSVYDLDYMISPESYDGTFAWINTPQYGSETAMGVVVEGNALYTTGALNSITLGGSM